MAARMAMMAITTNNSIKVNAPFCDLLQVIFFMLTESIPSSAVCLNFPRLELGLSPNTPSRGFLTLNSSSTYCFFINRKN
jgi:hypothetical protein